jgi:carbonic anhydrase
LTLGLGNTFSQESRSERSVQAAPGDFLDNAIRKSAERTAQRLTTARTVLSELVEAGKLKIVAAHYDLDTGVVEFLG